MAESSIELSKTECQELKHCNKCGENKLKSEFSKDRARNDGLQAYCKRCNAEYCKANKERIRRLAAEYRKKNAKRLAFINKQYRDKNKLELKKLSKEYYDKNRTSILEQKKIYNKENKSAISERRKKYNAEHKEEIAQRRRRYYQKNKKRILEFDKKHRRTTKGKANEKKKQNKRRALKAGVAFEIFKPSTVLERDGYICQLCGRKTRPDFKNHNHPLYPNLDHIIPLSLGGDHTMKNTQCLCHQCNIEKCNSGTGDQLRMFG